MIQITGWYESNRADNLGSSFMNPPLAVNPLIIEHIPHAVPVVIVWGIMLRFYLAQRRAGRERLASSATTPAAERVASSEAVAAAGRVPTRRFRAVDGGSGLTAQGGGRETPAVVGRPPA
jgi:hypothetical protein